MVGNCLFSDYHENKRLFVSQSLISSTDCHNFNDEARKAAFQLTCFQLFSFDMNDSRITIVKNKVSKSIQ
jgi:hypothetical protein